MTLSEQNPKKLREVPFQVRGLDIEADGEDEDYQLAPPEGKSSDEILVSLLDPELLERAKNPPPLAETQPRGPIKLQFTLWQLLAILTFASVGLAGARVLPSGVFSFLVGFVVIALFLCLVLYS